MDIYLSLGFEDHAFLIYNILLQQTHFVPLLEIDPFFISTAVNCNKINTISYV
jgi:hypothetical protein